MCYDWRHRRRSKFLIQASTTTVVHSYSQSGPDAKRAADVLISQLTRTDICFWALVTNSWWTRSACVKREHALHSRQSQQFDINTMWPAVSSTKWKRLWKSLFFSFFSIWNETLWKTTFLMCVPLLVIDMTAQSQTWSYQSKRKGKDVVDRRQIMPLIPPSLYPCQIVISNIFLDSAKSRRLFM